MTKDEVVEEMARQLESIVAQCISAGWSDSYLSPAMKALQLYRLRNESRIDAKTFMDAWNAVCPSKIRAMTPSRVSALKKRSREPMFFDNWTDAIVRISNNDFCCGKNDRGWMANVDWFLRPNTVVSIMEGKYDRRKIVLDMAKEGIRLKRRNAVVNNRSVEEHDAEWVKANQPLF